ncbi:putative hydroxymethylpyrimidine transport system permease protein [Rhizobium sp. RU20A]|uniref:ABC transporter permease n=1 Tax=Rhizobium sp. RU20A TaxID=1907412 RepID=UPI0009544EF9|nr:ABC transporter permease [Rhizobium sp. RU20A]SIQ34212.1 putative hydroxymethylpyrimidine transport system permease protein [Rhizobium sp. RU20A]
MRPADALGGLALVLALWQAVVSLAAPPSYLLPAPAEVAAVFARMGGSLAAHAGATGLEAVAGFVIGSLLGAGAAFAVAAFPAFGRFAWPVLMVVQAVPVFALAPLLVIWFGFGLASKIAMATLVIFFPVASAFADGLRRTDPVLLDAAALTPASPLQVLLRLRVPLALPALVSGLRIAAPLAPLAAVVGEWVGASSGLGFLMVQANARMQTATLFAALILVAAMSVALRLLVDRLTAGLTPWARDDTLSTPSVHRPAPQRPVPHHPPTHRLETA